MSEQVKGKRKRKRWGIIILVVVIVILVAVTIRAIPYIQMIRPKPMQSGSGAKTVACIGDSITYGQGVMDSRETDSYPAQLASMLGDEYKVINYGASNRTAVDDSSMPYEETGFVEKALAAEPDIVVIMLGTNDSKGENWDAEKYEADYTRILDNFVSASGKPEVYIMLPPQSFRGKDLEHADESTIDNEVIGGELRDILSRIAEENGAKVIDLYPVLNDDGLFSDGLHPNAEGNKLLAETVYQAISF